MADALCRLLAARALAQDVQQLRGPRGRLFQDLSALEAAGAAGEVVRICESGVFGYGAPVAADQARFGELRTAVYRRLECAPPARTAVVAAMRAGFGH